MMLLQLVLSQIGTIRERLYENSGRPGFIRGAQAWNMYMTENGDETPRQLLKSDREQRYQVLTTLLTWTAEEFRELGHQENADAITAIKDKVASKLGR